MDKQRILKEAQEIAKKYSFWMVSGNITHLYGYVYEVSDRKYELEIKFDENFPFKPPELVYHDEIKKLLGNFELEKYVNWTSDYSAVDLVDELMIKVQNALSPSMTVKDESKPSIKLTENSSPNLEEEEEEEYITPDMNTYPPDFQYEKFITPSDQNSEIFLNGTSNKDIPQSNEKIDDILAQPKEKQYSDEVVQLSVLISTELSLIQQEYAYDQIGQNAAEVNVYVTITLAKTFVIKIDFTDFPKRPSLQFPEEIEGFFGDPSANLGTLNRWDSKKPLHIVDILHEIENKLNFIKEIEIQLKKIAGEYQCEIVPENLTVLRVFLLTYGFKEYEIDIDLNAYPKPPVINLSLELENIISTPVAEIKSYKNWVDNESEPVEIVREISWLVDKNSRINFEIDLLRDHYNDLKYDPIATTLIVDMKGKMKTEDLTFKFQINLPEEYPMKIPEIKVLNEFELEAHEKIKKDLHSSFSDFFNEWTSSSYLIDLFNLISKKIFEVSVVSCVICHKLDCPICSKKIAGDNNCHAECPHCNRAYHQHCWEQTIKSFGKCGFCLR